MSTFRLGLITHCEIDQLRPALFSMTSLDLNCTARCHAEDRLVFPLTLGTNVSIAAIRDCTPTIVPRVANLGAVSALRQS